MAASRQQILADKIHKAGIIYFLLGDGGYCFLDFLTHSKTSTTVTIRSRLFFTAKIVFLPLFGNRKRSAPYRSSSKISVSKETVGFEVRSEICRAKQCEKESSPVFSPFGRAEKRLQKLQRAANCVGDSWTPSL